MRVKSRIWVSIVASVAVSAIIAYFVFSILSGVSDDISRNARYTEVINKAFALNILIDNIKTEPSLRNMQQAGDVHTSLNRLLADEVSLDVREEALLKQIKRTNQEIGPLLGQFFAPGEGPGSPLERERKDMLASQLWIKVRFITDDTNRLMEISQARIVSAQKKAGVAVLVLIAALILTNAAIFFVSSRSIVRNVRVLSEGVMSISGGDLDHRIRVTGRSELADLAETFNAMTGSLQGSYGRLRRHTQELERSNRELRDFTYVATHDLREPLRKIQTFNDLVKDESGDRLSERSLDFLERAINAAGRMQSLIDALLEYSSLSMGRKPFPQTDLSAVAREVVEDLSVRITDTGGRIDMGDLPAIEADPTQMRQLFQNVISNALKYHRAGVLPEIRVRSRKVRDPGNGKEMCEISISDNGIGFDEQYLGKIFTPFQRLHGKTEYEGTGIGLAICRRIVESHSGAITARSTPGEGSTFIIALPVKQEVTGLEESAHESPPLEFSRQKDKTKEKQR
jgi:signal transduction histidine kinase